MSSRNICLLIALGIFLIFTFGCEEAHMIRSVMITPEGEPTRHLGQTTFKVSVKVDHDERDADGNPVRINVLQPVITPPVTQPPTPRPAEVVEEPIVEPSVIEEPVVSFKNDILPIFKANCQACHRPRLRGVGHDRIPPAGNLDLTNYKSAMRALIIDPGWSEDSPIVRRISTTNSLRRMPPEGPPLSAEQIQLIRDWIDAGAKNN